jgi:hypothetical protein
VRRVFENRLGAIVFALGLLAMSTAPLLPRTQAVPHTVVEEPLWPSRIEGAAVLELPLSKTETQFAMNFPGRIKRFTDGRRVFILRWVTYTTRKLHPAADCFRGLGYEVQPRGIVIDKSEREWGLTLAKQNGRTLRVTERIEDGAGNAWTDSQTWFWAAAFGRTSGPWRATTVVE